MDLQLKGKVVLITGGAKGIGAAIVRECAREGATPVIADKDGSAAAQLQHELKAGPLPCEFVQTELTDEKACRAAVEFTLQKFNRLDGLVNNAGINDGIGLADGSPEKFLASLGRNLLHIYNITHYAVASLKRSRGSIVNISSKTAVTGRAAPPATSQRKPPSSALPANGPSNSFPTAFALTRSFPLKS